MPGGVADFLGVPVPELRRIVDAWLEEHGDLGHEDLVRFVRKLWRRPLHELRGVAIVILERGGNLLRGEDLALLESMLRRSFTWAYVDAIAVRIVGLLAGYRFA